MQLKCTRFHMFLLSFEGVVAGLIFGKFRCWNKPPWTIVILYYIIQSCCSCCSCSGDFQVTRHQHESNNKANYVWQAHHLYPSPYVLGEVILDYEWRGCEREVEFIILYSTEWTGINTWAVTILASGNVENTFLTFLTCHKKGMLLF